MAKRLPRISYLFDFAWQIQLKLMVEINALLQPHKTK